MQGRSLLDLFNGSAESPYAEAGQVGYELVGALLLFRVVQCAVVVQRADDNGGRRVRSCDQGKYLLAVPVRSE